VTQLVLAINLRHRDVNWEGQLQADGPIMQIGYQTDELPCLDGLDPFQFFAGCTGMQPKIPLDRVEYVCDARGLDD